eukprot:350100_1
MGTCCQRTLNSHSIHKDDEQSIAKLADSIQEVLTNVYMGSAVAAKNRELLLNQDITHVLAIGWNLEKYYENEFKYLLINRIEDSPECLILYQFEKCFNFINECFDNDGRLFIHCHKGLSRSATIVIAYEMFKTKTDFDTVLAKIRENRSFIMPNIGFQAQLHEFYNQNYSLNMDKYKHFDVISFIQKRLPLMCDKIKKNYNAYKFGKTDNINENELFELTLCMYNIFKLKQKDKLNEYDIKILNESIQTLRSIQVEFVKNESSIKRFDIMFRTKKKSEHKSNESIDNNNDCNNESQKLISN